MQFYAIGSRTKKDKATGEVVTVSVLMRDLPNDRLGAVREAEDRAKRERIKLVGVYPYRPKS